MIMILKSSITYWTCFHDNFSINGNENRVRSASNFRYLSTSGCINMGMIASESGDLDVLNSQELEL